MRAWMMLLVLSAVPAMAQVQMLKEDSAPVPPVVAFLQGPEGRVTVAATSMHLLAVAEPEIVVPAGVPQEGVVSLRVKVSRTGRVTEAAPIRGDEALGRAAVDGVLTRWIYRPLLINGEPQEFQSSMVLQFRDGAGKRAAMSDAVSVGGVLGGVMGAVGTSPSAMPVPGGAMRISSGVAAGMMEHAVAPVYPPVARAAHVQGVVILHALISKTGEIENLQLISGHPMLVSSAMDAVRQWRYHPYVLNGVPTDVETTINVNFTFSNPPKPGAGGAESGGMAPMAGAPDGK